MVNPSQTVQLALEQGDGIYRLAPAWVPRSFCIPGRRLKLHDLDYYALGTNRGGIDERWFASTIKADNGPLTGEFEGLSMIVFEGKAEVPLATAVQELKGEVVGDGIWNKFKEWPMYSKFFDNEEPLPHHLHQLLIHAKLTGQVEKPEAYYFPPQLDSIHGGDRPTTYFGLNPGTTKEEVYRCLEIFADEKGDNRLTALSHGHRLTPGTGWQVNAGVLHAPGSYCTYEPQKRSDVFAMYESVTENRRDVPVELLWKNSRPGARESRDIEYLMDQLDWEANVDPYFVKNNFMEPVPVKPLEEMRRKGYEDRWICYKSKDYSAKELTILPGQTVTIRDNAAYGLIMMQGNGTMNNLEISTPSMIRFGQFTHDEYFVTEKAAQKGVKIVNHSKSDPIVMLKHFGPGNPDLPMELLSA
jgi:hypothetical protein